MGKKDILNKVKANQPPFQELPEITFLHKQEHLTEDFLTVLKNVGGLGYLVSSFEDIRKTVKEKFPDAQRVISLYKELDALGARPGFYEKPHQFEDVSVVLIKAELAVAENGAVWIPEENMKERVLPFICEHLVVFINEKDIVATMHHAYEKIGERSYGFAAFIAGPSKTADIEQSLVLGAHGPKSLTLFVLKGK